KDYRRFYRRLKTESFDLVLLNPSLNPKSFFRDSLFALACSMAGVKFVVFWRGWNWDFEKKVVSRIQPFFRRTFGRADAMISLAREFENRLREYGYQKPTYLETTVVDNFIFNFDAESSDTRPTRPEGAETVMLFLARVEKVKGVYECIDSFHHLQPKYPNTVLNIAGVGGELEAAKQYVAEKGIKNVHFLGWISGKPKARALHDADIYLFPSYHGEGMPNSLLEAMASGLSVITTDVGGIKDFFQPEKMGLYVRPADTAHLEMQMDRLLSSQDFLKKTSAYNATYAREHFTPELVSGRLGQIFRNTILGKNAEVSFNDVEVSNNGVNITAEEMETSAKRL
ncbi:MAG: glycosyltransferase family 4 protein, partial [Phaeodactylibacter sp.]|nr:glycosyltransferase family 4 protein [Phaeodactylibacter sp.]